MIDKIHPSSVQDRLGGTLAIHLHAVRQGASIVRCHDVYEHKQALLVQQSIEGAM
jgi:dihydropteroate synthase